MLATPPLMRPTTCQVTSPHSPFNIVSEPAIIPPVCSSVQVPPFSGSVPFPLTSSQFTGAEVQYPKGATSIAAGQLRSEGQLDVAVPDTAGTVQWPYTGAGLAWRFVSTISRKIPCP